jgi:hypothetical protein
MKYEQKCIISIFYFYEESESAFSFTLGIKRPTFRSTVTLTSATYIKLTFTEGHKRITGCSFLRPHSSYEAFLEDLDNITQGN